MCTCFTYACFFSIYFLPLRVLSCICACYRKTSRNTANLIVFPIIPSIYQVHDYTDIYRKHKFGTDTLIVYKKKKIKGLLISITIESGDFTNYIQSNYQSWSSQYQLYWSRYNAMRFGSYTPIYFIFSAFISFPYLVPFFFWSLYRW